MTIWVLIFYVSTGFYTTATGGPATIDGFASKETCEAAAAQIKQTVKGYDWSVCMPFKK